MSRMSLGMALFMVLVFTFERLPDEYSGQVCEDEGLDKRYQDFNEINEYREQDRDG